jgi:diacylglycerol kinase family enzyme
MRRAALIYNPASGQHSMGRRAAIDKALAILREAGVEAEALETNAPGSAGVLAKDAMRRGCDTILACGGDGTVHEVLQSLVGHQRRFGSGAAGAPPTHWRRISACIPPRQKQSASC